MIRTKRVFERASPGDGVRFLVDRLWPRGLKKKDLQLDAWLRDVAPSDALCRWFGHDPARWPEFQRRYSAELDARPHDWQPIVEAARKDKVTLLFGSRDVTHNNAVALAHYISRLEFRMEGW
ncbi:MAG: DUF488 family protein [Acidobacteria bacterium]|nr:DUF488 family protein [Acidobacteriota bacterium]